MGKRNGIGKKIHKKMGEGGGKLERENKWYRSCSYLLFRGYLVSAYGRVLKSKNNSEVF